MSATLLLALALGAAIGLTLGVVGGGGAILAVPVLVGVLDQDPHMATTSSLVVVGAAALVAGLRHAGHRHVCWRVAVVFTLAAIPGAMLGTLANGVASGRLLLSLLAVLILAVAYLTWRRAVAGGGKTPERRLACPALPFLPLAATGLGIGVLTGFFGVGGGFVIVPALAIALHVPFRLAIGTSLVIIFMVSLTAFVNHMAAGADVDWATTLPFAGAAVGGSFFGAQIAHRFSQAALGKAFAVLLVGVAIMTFAIA